MTKAYKNKQLQGFTIVELLIVIVVVGILAAITIVAYQGIAARAQASSAQAGLSQANKKLAAYLVDSSSYPTTQAGFDALVPGNSTTYQYTGTSTSYCVTATNGTTSYKASSTVTQPSSGGCAGHGVGGTPPVTNYVIKPYPMAGNSGAWTGYNVAGGHTLSVGPDLYNSRGTWRMTSGAAGISANASLGYEYQGLGIAVTPGISIKPSIYVRSSKTGTFGLYYQFWNNTTSVGSGYYLASTTVPASTWTRIISPDIVVPATTDRMTIRAQYLSGITWAAADWFEVTQVTTAPGEYADGNSPDWAWSGTANNSSSSGPQL